MTPPQEIQSLCPRCAEGCGLYTLLEQGKATGIEYMKDHPVNAGALCFRGNGVLDTVYHPERIYAPLAKKEDGTFDTMSWDEAIAIISSRLKSIAAKHGPNALAFMSSACCSNEENYLFQKFARVLGTNNITCLADGEGTGPRGTALASPLGYAGMTNPFSDLAEAQCIIITGSHFLDNHPIASRWVFEARAKGATVICADHRVPPAPWFCDYFLQLRPGTQAALMEGMILHILENRLYKEKFIEERTSGFEAFQKTMKKQSMKQCEQTSGIPATTIREIAERYVSARASSLVQCVDYNGLYANTTISLLHAANLALLSGHLGRTGAGIFPLLSHSNEQGSYDMGISPRMFPGQIDFKDHAHNARIAKLWKIKNLPSKEGIHLGSIPKAIKNQRMKAMYLMESNPCMDSSSAGQFQSALKGLEFLVVQDLFLTETAQQADIVLPAPSWAEKIGTYTNTERRVQWQSKIINAQKQIIPSWQVLCSVAKKMGFAKQFSYSNPEAILSEINKTVTAYAGITPTRVKKTDGIISPCPTTKHPGTPILYTEQFSTSDGRGRFTPAVYERKEEKPTKKYPFRLTCGQVIVSVPPEQIGTPSAEPVITVEINPKDAKKIPLQSSGEVKIITTWGSVKATALITDRVIPGVVFIPFVPAGVTAGAHGPLDPRVHVPQLNAQTCQIKKSGGI